MPCLDPSPSSRPSHSNQRCLAVQPVQLINNYWILITSVRFLCVTLFLDPEEKYGYIILSENEFPINDER